ncbi:MAG: sigma-70 family RNA polymerase sigma factor [Sagittula sp.]|uniref:sigma-70 family RNA polymerase sigma factor n=1 Tax=Sagittula sp. TaxID=2038081 RepID=UPI00405815E8
MFTATDTADPCDSLPPAIPAGGGRSRVRRPKRTAVNRQSDSEREEEQATWAALLIRIRDHRDEAAFAALFAHFAPRLKGFLIRSGADAAQAEECVQEVMTTLWQKAAQFDPDRASAATWLFTIARNKRIDLLRRSRRPEPEDLPWGPEPDPDQADMLGLQQETEALGAAVAALPPKQRDLIHKAYFGEMTHSEIAAETGLPLGTIKSRIRLALDRLRHAMDGKNER